MRKLCRASAAILLVTVMSFMSFGQKTYWNQIEESEIPSSGTREIHARKFVTFRVDLDGLKESLLNADYRVNANGALVTIKFPHPDGTFHDYRVYRNTTMHPDLAAILPGAAKADELQNRILHAYNDDNGVPPRWNDQLRKMV